MATPKTLSTRPTLESSTCSDELGTKRSMERIVNDFIINVATANGTGSQSSNLIILHSMFEMGVPVSGKNLFPSNISGLPTWFIIRASDKGYQAPGDVTNIQILMNKDTWIKDLEKLDPGTIVVYNEDVKMPVEREEVFTILDVLQEEGEVFFDTQEDAWYIADSPEAQTAMDWDADAGRPAHMRDEDWD